MSTANFTAVALQKVRSVANGEAVELKTLWENQSVAIIFFRRWGCMLCRLWAKELGEIAPVLKKHNINLVGIGVEEAGCKDFVNGKYFDGDLYYVDSLSTYQLLGFKRFNVVSIISTLFWKQSRDAIFKGRGMGISCDLVGDGLQNGGALLVLEGGKILHHFIALGPADRLSGDLKGDWGQCGGALLVEKGGNLLHSFVQTGPGDHLPNEDILKHFGLEHEYKPETMANKKVDENDCAAAVLPTEA